jgi:hypothetical protein
MKRIVLLSTRQNIGVLAGAIVATCALQLHASDQVLTIGGGYSPSGNQVSLEKNVLFFQRVLRNLGLGGVPHHILFSDGTHPGRDLQWSDPSQPVPKLNAILARLLGSTKGLNHFYRTHQIAEVNGTSSISQIDRWFNSSGVKLKKDDRLLLYFTGHGGKTIKKNTQNTKMYLWNQSSMPVSELVKRLDKLPTQTPVVMVMVQCYSGGFANVIFKEGDPKKGLADHPRCGFFATVHNRLAAGCTPDINEANYQEYSSYFWAALNGRNRLGQVIQKPDYDRDGLISFAEAHAYALLSSKTIDISIKTSDAFLRHFSATKSKDPKKPVKGLLTADSSYRMLLTVARPCETAVLDGLSKQLKIRGDDRTKQVRKLSAKISADRKGISAKKKPIDQKYHAIRKELSGLIKRNWPELYNPWHPSVRKILADEGDQILEVLTKHKRFKELGQLVKQGSVLSKQSSELERKWVKCQRFIYTAENVALEANLPLLASPKIQDRYARLIAAEAETLGQQQPKLRHAKATGQ